MNASQPGRPRRTATTLPRQILRGSRDYMGALVAFVAIVIVLMITEDGFASTGNLQNVLQTNAPLLLISLGMTFVVISAGFDLSVGALMALSEHVLVRLINDAHLNPILAIVLTTVFCGIVGAMLNGVSIGILKLNFFVATLASMILVQGAVLVTSGGVTTVINSKWLQDFGTSKIGLVPVPVVLCLAVIVASSFVLRWTAYGRAVYCVGGNQEAARLSGISVPAVLVGVYGISGMFAALAGVVDASRLSAATPTAGNTVALTSAAAVLLGGASLSGGVGKIAGSVIGVLVLALLSNGVDLLGFSPYWQYVVTGAVLFIAIVLDRLHKSGVAGRIVDLSARRRNAPPEGEPVPATA